MTGTTTMSCTWFVSRYQVELSDVEPFASEALNQSLTLSAAVAVHKPGSRHLHVNNKLSIYRVAGVKRSSASLCVCVCLSAR